MPELGLRAPDLMEHIDIGRRLLMGSSGVSTEPVCATAISPVDLSSLVQGSRNSRTQRADGS